MDPIADMFSQIKNAQDAGKESLVVPFSKIKMAILEILKNNQYIKNYSRINGVKTKAKIAEGNEPNKTIDFEKKPPAFTAQPALLEIVLNKKEASYFKIQRVSKPGRRVYAQANNIPKVKSPRGLVIVSTSEGLMIGEDARKKSLGGEVVGEII